MIAFALHVSVGVMTLTWVVVATFVGGLVACAKRLTAKPQLTGQITATFSVAAAGGSAEKLAVKGLDKEVDACVATELRQIVFPAPRGGSTVDAVATFVFAPEIDPNDPLRQR